MGLNEELISLTIRNSEVVDQSFYLLEKVDHRFLQFFKDTAPLILSEVFVDWRYDYPKDTFAFWPQSWYFSDDRRAFFDLRILRDNKFWLNCFTGQNADMGLEFMISPYLFGSHESEAQILKQKFYHENEAELRKQNFYLSLREFRNRYGEYTIIFHPFRLDIDLIADEYPDWSKQILIPFTKCLEDIKTCLQIFNDFVLHVEAYKST